MNNIIFISSFDPICNADIDIINKINDYCSFKGNKLILCLINYMAKEKNISRYKMLSLAIEKDIEIKTIEEEKLELNKLHYLYPDDVFLIDYDLAKNILIGDILHDDSIYFLVDSIKRNEVKNLISNKRISSLNYEGILQREKIRKGSYLPSDKNVLDFILDNRLYFCKELYEKEKEHRYYHSVSVAKTAYEIAKRNNYDENLCYIAGLYHDIGKHVSINESLEIMNKYFKEYLPCPEFAMHQFVGAYLAINEYKIPTQCYSPIMFHCTGKKEMSTIDKIIFCADKVEPTRNFETYFNRMACFKNIDDGFITLLKNQQDRYIKNNIPFKEYYLSKEMYNYYLNEEIKND